MRGREGSCADIWPVCFYCREKFNADRTVEHLLALSLGGNDEIENLVLAHRECNLKAGVLLPEDKHLLAKAIQEKNILEEQRLLLKAKKICRTITPNLSNTWKKRNRRYNKCHPRLPDKHCEIQSKLAFTLK
jgi:hypothetical protein